MSQSPSSGDNPTDIAHRPSHYATLADWLLYRFSIYAVPLAVALITGYGLITWPAHYTGYGAAPLPFKAIETSSAADDTPKTALQRLRQSAQSTSVDTHLSERAFWLTVSPHAADAGAAHVLDFPSRHALSLACWDASTLQHLGQANRSAAVGALYPARAGFAMDLPSSPEAESRELLCRATFSGPARITLLQWPAEQFVSAKAAFARESGLLDGGLVILTVFITLTALINREWIYVVFAAWLAANLRIAALSSGLDTLWLGFEIPPDWMFTLRKWAMAAYCVLTIVLFCRLFVDELKQVKCARLMNWVLWSSLPLLASALLLPYQSFLPLFWLLAVFSVAGIIFSIARILLIARSAVAVWYALSIAVTVAANFNEVIAAALGAKALIGIFNSVTAALISSLMAALAIAEQIHQDRIARRRAQEELRKTYDAMPVGLFTLDEKGRLMRANPALESIIGSHAWEGKTWQSFFGERNWEKLRRGLENASEHEVELAVGPAGNERFFLVRATRANGHIEGFLQDITQRKLATAQLQFLAEHDPLTAILNRRGLETTYKRLSSRTLALAYIDLDRFKLINDLYGHAAGDDILKQICEQFSGMLDPDSHFLGRVGGDEFAIIFDSDDIAAIERRCREMLDGIFGDYFHSGEKSLVVNASIGLIEVPPGVPLTEAISAADRACRSAKDSGTNRIVVYHRSDAVFAERAEELRIIKQISHQELPRGLMLYAQPIMSTRAPYYSSNFEFLLRMRETGSSRIESAWKIIKTAEASGHISVIDRWVFRHALDWIETNLDALDRTHTANLNLSGASLNDARFVEDVFAMLAEHPNAARKVCIEITESVALNDIEHSLRFIEKANNLGSRIALDDFGAGYTSFSYLSKLPADAVKIDGQFVVGAASHPANMAIVSAISDLSRNLGMQSIAEWVEDLNTLKSMTEIGIDHIQGFVIARPQPLERMLEGGSAADFIEDREVAEYVKSIQSLDLWSTQDFNNKGLH